MPHTYHHHHHHDHHHGHHGHGGDGDGDHGHGGFPWEHGGFPWEHGGFPWEHGGLPGGLPGGPGGPFGHGGDWHWGSGDGFGNWLDHGGNDHGLFGASASDSILGGLGQDSVHGAGPHGGHGDDSVAGGHGDHGGHGPDSIQGGMQGGTDHHPLFGGPGADTILGGQGDDTLIGGGGHDSIVGGKGFDVAIYDHSKPHGFSFDANTDTYNWGPLGTTKGVEFHQFTDGVQITVHNEGEAAVARMFQLVNGEDPTASQFKSALDLLQGGKSVADVVKSTFSDLADKSAGDHHGNSDFVHDTYHNIGIDNPSSDLLNHFVKQLDAGTLSKADIVAAIALHTSSEDDALGIHIDKSFH